MIDGVYDVIVMIEFFVKKLSVYWMIDSMNRWNDLLKVVCIIRNIVIMIVLIREIFYIVGKKLNVLMYNDNYVKQSFYVNMFEID